MHVYFNVRFRSPCSYRLHKVGLRHFLTVFFPQHLSTVNFTIHVSFAFVYYGFDLSIRVIYAYTLSFVGDQL